MYVLQKPEILQLIIFTKWIPENKQIFLLVTCACWLWYWNSVFCQMRQGFQLSVISSYSGHFFSDWFKNLEEYCRCELPKWYCWVLVADVVLFCVVCLFLLFSLFFFSMCVIKKTYWIEEYVVDVVSVREMWEFPRASSGSVLVLSWKEVIDSSQQHTSLILLNKSFALFLSITYNIHILKASSYMRIIDEKRVII